MTFIADRLGTRFYQCDICKKQGIWRKEWGWYGSYSHQETCPSDLPVACSEKCKVVLEQKIENGEFVLPKLRADAGGMRVTHQRIGY
jgi:hypothetical protein